MNAVLSAKKSFDAFAAVTLATLLYWHFVVTHKSVDDLIPNIISDIVFAVFIVLFIEYANRKDRELRNRARQRAVARTVQACYQNHVEIITSLIADGVNVSDLSAIPTSEMVETRARSVHNEIRPPGGFPGDPIPYAAFFVCGSMGTSPAAVYPPRTTRDYLSQLAGKVDQSLSRRIPS
ncbi:MAG: hypothetical protein HY543_02540 [Deltaproteobacteria bacterium]|nr:hypothetical protein [Deltaproteobacteria bacterium]